MMSAYAKDCLFLKFFGAEKLRCFQSIYLQRLLHIILEARICVNKYQGKFSLGVWNS